MDGIIKKLWSKKLLKHIFPETLTKAVYDDNGNRLDNILTDLNSDLSKLKTWRFIGRKVAPSSITLADLDFENNTEVFIMIHINNGEWYSPSRVFPLTANRYGSRNHEKYADNTEVEYFFNLWDGTQPIRVSLAKDQGTDVTDKTTITVAVR